MNRIIAALAAGLALGLAAQGAAAQSSENLVKYRQSVMKAIGGHTGAIAAVVKGEVAYGDHVAGHARGIKEMSLIVQDIFPPESGPDSFKETRALAKIWAEPDKFKEAVGAFRKAAADFAEVAEGGDMAAIGDGLGALGKSCGGCHKPFRAEKE
ncbi:MAG: cytochrome c [Rhodospirillales bacterium]|nr:cytochrome c [Rhodospirillales bacterium]